MPIDYRYRDAAQELMKSIVEIEWAMFQQVQGIDGRADCQDDQETFVIMRMSQFASWEQYTLESYMMDLQNALKEGRNLVMEKYAYMMAETDPGYYAQIKHLLPPIDQECYELADLITDQYMAWEHEVGELYPHVRDHGRPAEAAAADGTTSFRNYLRCELLTYSKKTLMLHYSSIIAFPEVNRYLLSMEAMAKAYGYKTLAEAERALS